MSDHYYNSPYFEQGEPERPVAGMIADLDRSEMYELNAMAVYLCEDGGYLVVAVCGCSCWPDVGSTAQTYCHSKAEVDRAVRGAEGEWAPLLDLCQQAKWEARAATGKARAATGAGGTDEHR